MLILQLCWLMGQAFFNGRELEVAAKIAAMTTTTTAAAAAEITTISMILVSDINMI